MRALPPYPLGRRPVRARILAVYRVEPAALATLLPAGSRPRLVQGRAIAVACYTRLGATRLFGNRPADTSHLAYRFSLQHEDGEERAWIARRETSSWFAARCGSKLLQRVYGRSTFRVKEDAFGVELAVEGEGGEEFYLRAEATGAARGSVFASGHALEDFLAGDCAVEPHDLFAPEADELDRARSFAPEPMTVFESRSAFLSGERFPRGSVELDSAWRLSTRRLVGTGQRAEKRYRGLLETGDSSPALPTI